MSTYIDKLREINSRMEFMNIKGKEYAIVASRVQAFWELFPDGRIITELSDDGSRCDATAVVYRDQSSYAAATGHAYEEKGAGLVNKTSYVENAETSAIGRALGFLGIGSAESIASAEEVANAMHAQEAKATHERAVALLVDASKRCRALGATNEELRAIVKDATGKSKTADMNVNEVERAAEAVSIRAKELEG